MAAGGFMPQQFDQFPNDFIDFDPVLDRLLFLEERSNTTHYGPGTCAILNDLFSTLARLLQIGRGCRKPLQASISVGYNRSEGLADFVRYGCCEFAHAE